MPKIQQKLVDALGIEGREAVAKHKGDPTCGLYDGAVELSPREDLRLLGHVISALQFDSAERRALLAYAGMRQDAVSPRVACLLSRYLLAEVDREEASAAFDLPWDKRPYMTRDQVGPRLGLNVTRLSEVCAVEVDWLWPQRFPLGKFSLLNGDPDLGKSWVMLDIAARVTTGRRFVDSENPFGRPMDVLWHSAEDDDADTVRPRFDKLKGDATRFHSLGFVRADVAGKKGETSLKDSPLDLSVHLPHLDKYLFDHPLVVLVILDPLSAFLGNVDSHQNSKVRGLLTPLTALAAKRHVAIVGINHLNKGDGEHAMYRGIGSIGFVGAARSSWLVTPDPKERDRRLFTKIKANLQTVDVGGLAFRIGPHVPGALMWEPDPIRTTANESLRPPSAMSKSPALSDAKKWLADVLGDGPVLASEVWERAEADGLAPSTVKTAKAALSIRTKKTGGAGSPWSWSLPPGGATA